MVKMKGCETEVSSRNRPRQLPAKWFMLCNLTKPPKVTTNQQRFEKNIVKVQYWKMSNFTALQPRQQAIDTDCSEQKPQKPQKPQSTGRISHILFEG